MKKAKQSNLTIIIIIVAVVVLLAIIVPIIILVSRDSGTQTAVPYKPIVQPSVSPQTSAVKQTAPVQAKEICSTHRIVNELCSRSTGTDPLNVYYCRNIRECDGHCDKLCNNAGYPKVLSVIGRTQSIDLYTSRVYCDCSCEKCVYS